VANIIDGIVGQPADRKVRAVLDRTVKEFELAAEKVAVNHAEPAKFPLPSGTGFTEQILAQRFAKLPADTRKAAAAGAARRLGAHTPKAELGSVDLSKPTAIEQQVSALPFPAALAFTPAKVAAPAEMTAALAVQPPLRHLELRIHKVRCDDETNGLFGSEAGSDEIDLGGTTVDESGDTGKVSPFRVRSFGHDRDVQLYNPPRRFTFFNLTEGTAFPKTYVVTLALAEIDSGGFNEFLRKLTEKIKDRVIAALTAAIGGAVGASGGPIGIAIGVAVGYVVGKVFELLSNLWKDDVFKPVPVHVTIPSLSARWTGGKTDGPEQTAVFKGFGGQYTVTYDWKLYT